MKRQDKILAIVLFFASLGYFLLYCSAGINWMDEGTLVTPSERILAGQVAYRDFYRIYSPGQKYLFAALFFVLGHQFLITRIVWAIGHAAAAAMMYRLARRSLPTYYSMVPAIATVLAPGPWQKTPFILGIIAGMLLVVRYAEKPSPRRAAEMGLGAALIILFRQDVGAVFAAVGAIFIIKDSDERKTKSAYYLSFLLVPTAIWVGYFFVVGAGGEMLRQVAFAGARGFAFNPIPYPRIFDPLDCAGALDKFLSSLGRAAFYLPFLIVPLFYRVWFRERSEMSRVGNAIFIAATAGAILAVNQVRARSDFAHLWQAYPVFDLMAAAVIAQIASRKRALGATLSILFMVVVAGAALSSNELQHGGIRAMQGRTVKYANPKMPVKLTPEENNVISGVERTIGKHTKPGEYVFLAPDIPLFYFLTGRKNPTPWDVVRPSFLWGGDDEIKAIRLIDSAKVNLIVVREPDVIPQNEKSFFDTYPLLGSFIKNNYGIVERVDDFRFYLRNKGTP